MAQFTTHQSAPRATNTVTSVTNGEVKKFPADKRSCFSRNFSIKITLECVRLMATSPSANMERSASTVTATEVIARPANGIEEAPVLRLRLHKPKSDKKVSWGSETVDNEGMGKKKSKCCCVYHKPLSFGESSSESEDECKHCYGHVEMRKKKRIPGDDQGEPKPPEGCDETDQSGSSQDSGGSSASGGN